MNKLNERDGYKRSYFDKSFRQTNTNTGDENAKVDHTNDKTMHINDHVNRTSYEFRSAE